MRAIWLGSFLSIFLSTGCLDAEEIGDIAPDTAAVSLAASSPGGLAVIYGGPQPPLQPCPNVLTIVIDNENSNNHNWGSGWIGLTQPANNISFSFCPIGSGGFGNRPKPYALLSLDDNNCPAGSTRVIRHIDAEDALPIISSTNITSVPIVDNNGNVDMRFCVFSAQGNVNPSFPNLGYSYGVFALSDFPGALASGAVFSDDEDTNNNDYWVDSSGVNPFPGAALGIIGGMTDTGFQMVRWR